MKKPLAIRMRPTYIDDVLGQDNLVGINGILRNSIKSNTPLSFILYGPPGTGKTSIAESYAHSLNAHVIKFNATSLSKKDINDAISSNKLYDVKIIIIDEIHRLNKDKQDILLEALENGDIYLIGATTANPYISINKAIRSRLHIFELEPIKKDLIIEGIKKALSSQKGLNNRLKIDEESINYISSLSGGDFRFAYNFLELLSINYSEVNIEICKKISKNPNFFIDKDEDMHYDNISALQKSIRGQDVNAALFYAARILITGDLKSLCRRLLVISYEDIGLANPQACMRTKIAIDSAEYLGLPEAIIPISNAIIDLTLSPHSKSAEISINNALNSAKEPIDMPKYLKYTPVNLKESEKYPYDNEQLWVYLQYLPDLLKDAKFYEINKSSSSIYEKTLNENYEKLCKIVKSNNISLLKEKLKKN